MKELYEKVYIKSEADLPKEMIKIFAFREQSGEGFHIVVNPLDKGCMTNLLMFNWYLQPITESQLKEVDLRDELIEFGKWFNKKGQPLIKPTIDEYLIFKEQGKSKL